MTGSASVGVRRALGTVVVTVHEELDGSGAAHLDRILADLIDGQGNLAVVVDLGDVSVVESDGLAVLVAAAERAEGRGGALRLVNPPERVHQALEPRGLAGLFTPRPSVLGAGVQAEAPDS